MTWYIAFFQPLDKDSLNESWPSCEKLVSIANDGCGNQYVFDPKTDSKAILFYDHESEEFHEVSPTLDDFLTIVKYVINKNSE